MQGTITESRQLYQIYEERISNLPGQMNSIGRITVIPFIRNVSARVLLHAKRNVSLHPVDDTQLESMLEEARNIISLI